jgi:hypothetical protein
MLVPACGSGRACEGASSEAKVSPRARRNPLEGGVSPRARRNPLEGGVSPRARRNRLEGAFDWATSVGRGGHRSVGRALCVHLSKRCVLFLFFAGFKQDPPGFLGDPQGCPRQCCRCMRCLFQPTSAMFRPASAVPCTHTGICMHLGMSRRCSRAASPRAWAYSRRSGRALRLDCTPLRRPFAGRRSEVSTTPIERVTNRGSLVELLTGSSSGR